MADEAAVKELVRGAYDMHIHSEPDVLPRKFNDIVLAEHAIEAGMAGVVLKSHYICTADRASLINQMFPEIRAFGGLVLNNSMGGMNPLAVEVAGRLGNKVVWMPTVDAENEVKNITGENVDGKPQPYWMTIARAMRAKGIAGDPVKVVVDGKVTHAAIQCMEVIAEYDMILATGHISPEEMLPVVKAAREAKVNRVVITHPEFPATYLDQDQQKALGKYDVMFERCFTQPYTKKVEWETVYDNIRTIGPNSTILSTDLGQSTAPWVERASACSSATCWTTASRLLRSKRCPTTTPARSSDSSKPPRRSRKQSQTQREGLPAWEAPLVFAWGFP